VPCPGPEHGELIPLTVLGIHGPGNEIVIPYDATVESSESAKVAPR
jgi:hypothetical protein